MVVDGSGLLESKYPYTSFGSCKISGAVEFVAYSGGYPNLCMGDLTLKIGGKEYIFGYSHQHQQFWETSGKCWWDRHGKYRGDDFTEIGEWIIHRDSLPPEIRIHASDIDRVFNTNVRWGCCGGCL